MHQLAETLETRLAALDVARAPCGPECRFACELAGWPDFVWCERRGRPQFTRSHVDCASFSGRTSGQPLATLRAPPPRQNDLL